MGRHHLPGELYTWCIDMTAEELTKIRVYLGLGPVDMGRAMGVSYSTYRDWQSGKNRIPPVAARCARILAEMGDRDISYWVERTRSVRG